MHATRGRAVTAGVLFIVATAGGLVSAALVGALGVEGYLTEAAAQSTSVILGALIELVMIAAIVAIPVVMLPVLREHDEGLAQGYVVARIMESVPLVIGVIAMLCLLSLSRDFVATGQVEPAQVGVVGHLLNAARDWNVWIGAQMIFSLGALILNVALYRSRLVPRFLSVWGLIGVPLMFAAGVSGMFGLLDPTATMAYVLYLPLALQEIVFAVWLLVKGFNPEALSTR
jgi:hypothetical protein